MTDILNGVSSKPYRQLIGITLFLLFAFLFVFRIDGFFLGNQYHEEFRILYHYDAEKTNADDYSGQFLKQFPQPLLYAAVTKEFLQFGLDLELFHRLLGAFCFILFLAGIAVASMRLGGLFALAVTSFAAAQIIFYQQTSSATPHAFAFPLLAWGLVSLLYSRPYFAGILTLLAGLLYVPVTPLIGLMFAAQLVFLEEGLSKESNRRLLNLAYVVVVGLVSLILVITQLEPIEGYGAALVPGDRTDQYPENGPQGRYHISVFEPVYHVISSALGQFHQSIPALIALSLYAYVGIFAALGLYNLKEDVFLFKPTLVFVGVSVILFIVVFTLRPYLSYRFALYPLYTIIPFLFVYGLNNVLFRNARYLKVAIGIFLASIFALCLSLGMARDNQTNGWLILTNSDREMLKFISSTPKESLVAAWPNQAASSLIPYVAGRPLLVDMKAHYPSYEGHLLEMRDRMNALVDAFFEPTPKPIKSLYCQWGVDYLVFDRQAVSSSNLQLSYFAPFDQRIKELHSAAADSKIALLELPDEAIAFSSNQYRVVSLEYLITPGECEI